MASSFFADICVEFVLKSVALSELYLILDEELMITDGLVAVFMRSVLWGVLCMDHCTETKYGFCRAD